MRRRAKVRDFPRTLTVLTCSTLTLKISSIACRICVFVACGCTTKVYCWTSASAIAFSVIRGATITSRASIAILLFRFQGCRHRVVRGGGKDNPFEPEHVLDVQGAGVGECDARQVCADPRDLVRVGLVPAANDERGGTRTCRLGTAEEHLRERSGFGDTELAGIEERDGVVPKTVGQRCQKGQPAFLFVERFYVTARLRPKDDAAVPPLRRTDRALTGASGALLTPGLASAARNLVALARRGRSGSRICEFAMDRAVDDAELPAKIALERRGRLATAHDVAAGIDDVGHYAFAFRALTLSLTMTNEFLAPGTAPRTSRRLRSLSARTTSRFCSVVRS